MSASNSKDPLVEWNRLNIENAEQAFVSSMYQSISETTVTIDKFSLWLLAGTGASGALLVTQVSAVLPFLTEAGFKLCLLWLVLSAVLGFLAKFKALRCEIQIQIQTKLNEMLTPIFNKHGEDEDRIADYAKQRGIELQTDISLSNVIKEFAKPFPFWVGWLLNRQLSKMGDDRQAGHRIAVRAYMSQMRWTFYQAVSFIMFLLTGAWYASAI